MPLALTFDDGPDPDWTGRLLDVLADAGAPATFFPISSRAVAYPWLIDRILDGGHQIGLHCDEHVRHSDRSIEWCRRDTDHALDLLSSVGVRPTLWRTPWGDTAPWSAGVADEHQLAIIGWTVDTHDWRGDTRRADARRHEGRTAQRSDRPRARRNRARGPESMPARRSSTPR